MTELPYGFLSPSWPFCGEGGSIPLDSKKLWRELQDQRYLKNAREELERMIETRDWYQKNVDKYNEEIALLRSTLPAEEPEQK